MTSSLRIQLLGEFRLFLNDQPITTLNTARQQALLAYLLLHRHAPQPRRQIAFAFWPDSTESQAYTNLRKIVYQLRHALPILEEYIVGDTQSLGWRQDAPTALDVAELEQLLSGLATESLAHPARIEQIVGLYRGELLPICYDDWILPLRQALHEWITQALKQALDRLEAQGEVEAALLAAGHLLRLDPLHEGTYRHLMRLRARAGDRSGALRAYQDCAVMLERELGVAPAVETTALYHELLSEHLDEQRAAESSGALSLLVERSATAARHNLPAQLTPFVGRQKELEALDGLFATAEVRLITIVGPGGMGKTRLALQAAWRQLEAAKRASTPFAHGVYFVPLVALSGAAQIVPAVAAALGFALDSSSSQRRTPLEQLLDYLREKQILLLLDNFEHLQEGVALLTQIMEMAPGAWLLVTSRERLHLPGEQLFPLGGLALGKAEQTAGADEPDAITLFVQSARRVLPALALTPQEMQDVARISRLVEGMPLALELAAAWMATLSPAEIVQELHHSLDFLAIDRKGVPQRHDSMAALFDATWQRLNEEERTLFAALSVFRGGFTREAAQRVAGASLHQLSRLASKSLIQHERERNRYTLHELMRQYGAMRLAEVPSLEEVVRDHHSAFYVALLQQWQEQLKGKQQPAALAALDAERENISTAWRWSIAQSQREHLATTIDGLALYYELSHLAQEGVGLFEAAALALERMGETKLFVQALSWQAAFLLRLQQVEQAESLLSRCFDLLDTSALMQQETRFQRAFALLKMGELSIVQGNWLNNPYFAQSQALFEELEDLWYTAQASLGLYHLALSQGELERMTACLEKAIACYRTLGNERAMGTAFAYLAAAERRQGRAQKSLAMATNNLVAARSYGDLDAAAHSLQFIGDAYLELGEADKARQAHLEAAALFAEVGSRREEAIVYNKICMVELAAGDYNQARAFAQRALNFYASEEDHPDTSWFHAFLGVATLYTGTTEEAVASLYKALAIVESTDGAFSRCYVNALLAFGEWMGGHSRQARRHCLIALRLNVHFMDSLALNLVLSTAMALLAEEEDPQRALELYGLLRTIPYCGSAAWWLDTLGAQMEALIARTPAQVVQAALSRGKALDPRQMVTELLAEIEGLQWQ